MKKVDDRYGDKKEEVKDYFKDLKKIKLNSKKVYSSIYGNCTKGVKTINDCERESKNYLRMVTKENQDSCVGIRHEG